MRLTVNGRPQSRPETCSVAALVAEITEAEQETAAS